MLQGDYTLTFEPNRGVLEPREERSIKVTFTGYKKVGYTRYFRLPSGYRYSLFMFDAWSVQQGPISDLMTCCEVVRMPNPVWLSITADVQGLSVTFETPKLFDLDR